jgi:NAD(P)-dependent dehydrogenase (short-subunit alcohol dehydrogenase family)
MGSACARALVTDVDVVLLTDIDQDRLATVAESLASETTAAVSTLLGDLGDGAFVAELVTRVHASGRLHSLVHTAGLSPSMAVWDEILRVDLIATARLLDGFLPIAEPGSVAVCLASIAGHTGTFEPALDDLIVGPFDADFFSQIQAVVGSTPDPGATYRLAKRGVLLLCERAAIAWGARGGRVVSVSPGLIDTAMGHLELVKNPIKAWMAEMTPIRRRGSHADTLLPGTTEDVANVVAFLCSERAAFISGCDIRVDGGLTGVLNNQGLP